MTDALQDRLDNAVLQSRLDWAREPIDKSQGASIAARAAVGSVSKPEDRLTTIRKFYSDASPHGNDNFVFKHPETGKKTLYNPEGLDIGDVASVGPEAAEMVGGAAGAALAVAPAAAAVPATAGASLLAVPAAYGLGAAAGREIYTNFAQRFLGAEDTRDLPERFADVGVTGLINATGGRVGELVAQGVKKVGGPVARYAKGKLMQSGSQALGDFAEAGVTPSAGAVTGNRGIQIVETGLANTPGGAPVMQRHAEKQLAEVARAVDNLAEQYGNPKTIQGLGERLQKAAKSAGERFAARRNKLDDELETLIGAETRVPVSAVTKLRVSIEAQLSKAEASRSSVLKGSIDMLKQIEKDAGQGGIPFGALRSIRTDIGQKLEYPDVSGWNPAQAVSFRKVYGAIRKDIQESASAAGPKARKALGLHDRYVRFNRNVNLPLLEKIASQDTAEQAYRYAVGLSKEGGTRLTKLRRNIKGREWDDVAASVLGRMGRVRGQVTDMAEEAGEFSTKVFMTEFKKLSPEARRTLFSGTRYKELAPALNRLTRTMSRLGDAEKMANPSGTARALLAGLGIYAVGREGVIEGDPMGAVQTLAVGILAPRAAAKLITNPKFVQWLGNAVNNSVKGGVNAISGEIVRLALVAKAEPAIRGEIAKYINTFKKEPSGGE